MSVREDITERIGDWLIGVLMIAAYFFALSLMIGLPVLIWRAVFVCGAH